MSTDEQHVYDDKANDDQGEYNAQPQQMFLRRTFFFIWRTSRDGSCVAVGLCCAGGGQRSCRADGDGEAGKEFMTYECWRAGRPSGELAALEAFSSSSW